MKCARCQAQTKGQELTPGCHSAVCDACFKKKAPAGTQRTKPGTKPGRPKNAMVVTHEAASLKKKAARRRNKNS